jgi:hypothetical protein
MNGHRHNDQSLRLDRLEGMRLLQVFGISLALHLLLWGGYGLGKKYHWWERLHMPAWLQAITRPAPKKNPPQNPTQRTPAAMFVDVTKLLESTETPKNTPFYSDKNSVAANKDANKITDAPKIDGTQTQMAKVEDTPRKKFDQLMPDPPAPKPQTKPKVDPGDLTLARPDRPRTLRDAMLRNQANQRPGQAMKQDAGVTQRGSTAYDVKATGFGAYDRAFIDAVSSRWYALLDSMSYEGYRQGHVRVEFSLNYNGRITDLKIVENTVTESLSLLCRKAIEDPAPFETWPREMRQAVGEDQRRITFTFYYN